MSDQTTTIGELLDCEEGAVMTEFAVTLPVFLLFFGAIIGLGNLTQGAIQAHTNAAPHLWTDIFLAEDDDAFLEADRGVKQREEALGFEPRTPDISEIAEEVDDITASGQGHWGESSQSIGQWLENEDRIPDTHSAGVGAISNPRDSNMLGPGKDGSAPAAGLLDDRAGAILDFPYDSGASNTIFGDARDQIPQNTNAGWAAGIRYAAVARENEMTVDPGYGIPEAEYKISYSVRISPTHRGSTSVSVSGIDSDWLEDPETRSWMVARMYGDAHAEYSRLFELGQDPRLDKSKASDVDEY